MAISKDLLLAILSMDAYNQGYSPGLVHGKSQIGTAIMGDDSEILLDAQGNPIAEDAGFYGVAYEDVTHGNIIAYRGTDNFWNEIPAEVIPLAINDDYDEELVHLASQFYLAAFGGSSDYSVTLTGHSLGGGLAGFTGSLHNQNIVSVATIGFWPAF